MIAETCWPCIVGLHEECFQTEEVEDSWVRCCCFMHKNDEAEEFARGVGRPVAEPSDITDILSTGRKRAAMMYPIYEGMVCEWAGLRYAGGGVEPIIGCTGNILSIGKGPDKGDRHHGPDKNVINNSPENVHRICSKCHNRWHAQNNKYYSPERPPADQPYLPEQDWKKHDPETQATEEELAENEEFWASKKVRVALDD